MGRGRRRPGQAEHPAEGVQIGAGLVAGDGGRQQRGMIGQPPVDLIGRLGEEQIRVGPLPGVHIQPPLRQTADHLRLDALRRGLLQQRVKIQRH